MEETMQQPSIIEYMAPQAHEQGFMAKHTQAYS